LTEDKIERFVQTAITAQTYYVAFLIMQRVNGLQHRIMET